MFKQQKVRATKLLPLGNDHQRIRTIQCTVSGLAECQAVRIRVDDAGITVTDNGSPDENTLIDAYRRMRAQASVQAKINEVLEDETEEDQAEVPDDLRKRIEERLEGHPEVPWDEVVRDLVEAEEVDAVQ